MSEVYIYLFSGKKNQKLEIKRQFFFCRFLTKKCIYFLYFWGEYDFQEMKERLFKKIYTPKSWLQEREKLTEKLLFCPLSFRNHN